MELANDLAPEAVTEALPGREVRVYPALLSTSADALAWARSGAPEGSVVVADYQASPRGRAGLEWRVTPGVSLGFSLILRPRLAPDREGWMYTVGASGLADALGAATTIRWPDEVAQHGAVLGAVGVNVRLGEGGCEWATVDVLVSVARAPRAQLMARLVDAIERRCRSDAASVLTEYLPRCETLGKRVRARLIPMGPSGPEVSGKAVGSVLDGALVIVTDRGSRVAVRPQHLGLLELLDQASGEDSSG